jgi:hypothetical protein
MTFSNYLWFIWPTQPEFLSLNLRRLTGLKIIFGGTAIHAFLAIFLHGGPKKGAGGRIQPRCGQKFRPPQADIVRLAFNAFERIPRAARGREWCHACSQFLAHHQLSGSTE